MFQWRPIVVMCLSVWPAVSWANTEPASAPAAAAQPAAPAQQGVPPDWKPIEIELPRPLFVGTPRDLWTPNLEPPILTTREPVYAPKGVANLAEGASVTASQLRPLIGNLEQITDGEKEGSDGYFVEMASGLQYAQLDLGAPLDIFALVVWHFHMEPRVYFDVIVRVADDPDFITNVRTLFNNDHDNSAGLGVGKDKEYIETYEGKLIPVHGVRARYVRLYSRGNTSNELNHYIEVAVYGKPVE